MGARNNSLQMLLALLLSISSLSCGEGESFVHEEYPRLFQFSELRTQFSQAGISSPQLCQDVLENSTIRLYHLRESFQRWNASFTGFILQADTQLRNATISRQSTQATSGDQTRLNSTNGQHLTCDKNGSLTSNKSFIEFGEELASRFIDHCGELFAIDQSQSLVNRTGGNGSSVYKTQLECMKRLQNLALWPRTVIQCISEHAACKQCFNDCVVGHFVNGTFSCNAGPRLVSVDMSELDAQSLHVDYLALSSWMHVDLFASVQAYFLGKLSLLDNELRKTFLPDDPGRPNGQLQKELSSVMCNALAIPNRPMISTAQLCWQSCQDVRNSVEMLSALADIKKDPLLSLLAKATNVSCAKRPPETPHHPSTSTAQNPGCPFNKSMTDLTLCLSSECPYPVVATHTIRPWLEAIRTQSQNLRLLSNSVFPMAEAYPNSSAFSCGLQCVPVSSAESDKQVVRYVRLVFGFITTFFSSLSIAAFLLNRQQLAQLPWQLNVCFSVAYIIGLGSDSICASLLNEGNGIACYDDGTVKFGEPVNGRSLCAFVAFKYSFGLMLMAFFALGMAYEWYRMTGALLSRVQIDTNQSSSRESRAFVHVGLYVTMSAIIAAMPLARQKVRGYPLYGSCYPSSADQFYFFTIPFALLCVGMVTLIALGLPRLFKVYKGVRGFAKTVKHHWMLSRSPTQYRLSQVSTSRGRGGMERLISLHLLYIVLSTTNLLVVIPITAYVYSISDGVEEAFLRRVLCLMTRCDKSVCPPLFRVSLGVHLAGELQGNFTALTMSVWALSWKTYWRSHVLRLRDFLRRKHTLGFRRHFENARRRVSATFRKIDDAPSTSSTNTLDS